MNVGHTFITMVRSSSSYVSKYFCDAPMIILFLDHQSQLAPPWPSQDQGSTTLQGDVWVHQQYEFDRYRTECEAGSWTQNKVCVCLCCMYFYFSRNIHLYSGLRNARLLEKRAFTVTRLFKKSSMNNGSAIGKMMASNIPKCISHSQRLHWHLFLLLSVSYLIPAPHPWHILDWKLHWRMGWWNPNKYCIYAGGIWAHLPRASRRVEQVSWVHEGA